MLEVVFLELQKLSISAKAKVLSIKNQKHN